MAVVVRAQTALLEICPALEFFSQNILVFARRSEARTGAYMYLLRTMQYEVW